MVDALRAVMLPARLERRCGRAQVLRDVDAPDLVSYVEEWSSQADIDERIRSVPFNRLLALMEAAASAPTLEFRTISEVSGLEYVESVRDGRP